MGLQLIRNILPNTNGLYHYFENPRDFLYYFGPSQSLREITLDNYRINTNIIKVKIDNTLTEAVADTLTYAIDIRRDEDYNITYFRCYFIDKVTIQSGYAILNCTIDLWASYIWKAQIDHILVKRCNRLLTNYPIYDDIKAVEEREYIAKVDSDGVVNGLATPDYNNIYQEIRRYYLVMVINYNAKQNLTGSDYIATTCCMAIRLDNLRNKYIEGIDQDTDDPQEDALLNMSVIRMAQDFAGGVYGISANIGHNDANVINAYIVRDYAINDTGFNTSLKSISLLKNGSDLTINSIILGQSDYSSKLYIRNITPNRQYYFGKVHGGLKLNRAYSGTYINVYIRFIVSASNVEVIAIQGNNQEDITEAFMLTITNNVSETTPLRRIANAITQTGQMQKSIAKGYDESGALGVTSASLAGLASMVGDFSIDSKIRGDGDALQTFGGVANYVEVPFKATYFRSVIDEEDLIKLYGASFNKIYQSLNDIIATGPSYLFGDDYGTYIKGDIDIINLPKEANEYITALFNNGIHINKL